MTTLDELARTATRSVHHLAAEVDADAVYDRVRSSRRALALPRQMRPIAIGLVAVGALVAVLFASGFLQRDEVFVGNPGDGDAPVLLDGSWQRLDLGDVRGATIGGINRTASGHTLIVEDPNTGTVVLHSVDGVAWTPSPTTGIDGFLMTVQPGGQGLIATGTFETVLTSVDGTDWTPLFDPQTRLIALAADASGQVHALATSVPGDSGPPAAPGALHLVQWDGNEVTTTSLAPGAPGSPGSASRPQLIVTPVGVIVVAETEQGVATWMQVDGAWRSETHENVKTLVAATSTNTGLAVLDVEGTIWIGAGDELSQAADVGRPDEQTVEAMILRVGDSYAQMGTAFRGSIADLGVSLAVRRNSGAAEDGEAIDGERLWLSGLTSSDGQVFATAFATQSAGAPLPLAWRFVPDAP